MLDPTWVSAYTPSSAERELNRRIVRDAVLRRSRPVVAIGATAFVLSIVIAAVSGLWALTAIGVIALGVAVVLAASTLARVRRLVPATGARLRAHFTRVSAARDTERLGTIVTRLAATFGLADLETAVIADPGYNAALVPLDDGLILLVTDALLRDFELIELEGVIAHLMARERLGLLERLCAASVLSWGSRARSLAGVDSAFRADEVAAASIRYPLGLADALSRSASQNVAPSSYFATDDYRLSRWVWFNQFADGAAAEGDNDDPRVRARALTEW